MTDTWRCRACGMKLAGGGEALAIHLEASQACLDWYVEQDELTRLPLGNTLVVPPTVHWRRTHGNECEVVGVCPTGEFVSICFKPTVASAKAWASRWLKVEMR